MYIKNNLLIDFDISDNNNFNNIDFSIKSRTRWSGGVISDIVLNNYGLTQYDIGKSSSLLSDKAVSRNGDIYLKFERIGKPDNNGNILYDDYGLTPNGSGNIGTYLTSKGGYLNTVFKYHGYDIEYLPRQFENGFTIETTLLINKKTFVDSDYNSNIFLYLGIRGEDKFSDSYTGNTIYITENGSVLDNSYYIYDISKIRENTQNIDNIIKFLKTQSIYIKNNNQNEFILDDIESDKFVIVLNKNKLIPDIDYTFDIRSKKLTILNKNLVISDNLVINYYKNIDDIELVNFKLSDIENKNLIKEYGLNNNVIAFRFNQNREVGYRKINGNLEIEEDYSSVPFNQNGWVDLVIVFEPYEKIIQKINDECNISGRKGILKIYLNNVLFYHNENFLEPAFNALPIDSSKQIGLPYNISWGGGSFGLKYSYNFNNNQNFPYVKNPNNYNLLIENNFNGYFNGSFQKLRIYNKALLKNDISVNYEHESKYYNIKFNKGGRLIYYNQF
jgi:hypothetical protein